MRLGTRSRRLVSGVTRLRERLRIFRDREGSQRKGWCPREPFALPATELSHFLLKELEEVRSGVAGGGPARWREGGNWDYSPRKNNVFSFTSDFICNVRKLQNIEETYL